MARPPIRQVNGSPAVEPGQHVLGHCHERGLFPNTYTTIRDDDGNKNCRQLVSVCRSGAGGIP
jgi:hypothetical protein